MKVKMFGMDNIMAFWCADCAVSAAIIYFSLRNNLLSGDPLYLSIQIFGISMAAKPVTVMAMTQLENLGLRGKVSTL